VNALPSNTITTSGTTTICQGSSVTLTASSGSSYLWSNGATTQSINANIAGNYIVTVTNSSGCTSISSPILVSIISPTATITPSGPTNICSNSSVVLSANTGTSYLWSNGATTQTINVTTGGTYYVTVSQSGGCSATSAGTSIIVNPVATFTISTNGPLTFCRGGNVIISVSSTNAQGYAWYKNNSIINNATSSSYRATTAGTYLVRVQRGNCGVFSSPYVVSVPCREAELTSTGISAYPNPFSGQINFNLELSNPCEVSLRIYTLSGQLIDTYINEGESNINYNSESLANGIYIAEIKTSEETKRIKICKQN
jgi:hypothetical protein